MTEDFLQYAWKYKLCGNVFKALGGELIEVIHPGELNRNSGPDFFNARIRIDQVELAGNVEIHLSTSDWFQHGHEQDPAYDNLLLHVVYRHHEKYQHTPGRKMVILELKDYLPPNSLQNYDLLMKSTYSIPCGQLLKDIPDAIWSSWLHRLAVDRLEQRTQYMHDVFVYTGNDYEEALYIVLCRAFGFHVNSLPFELLAKKTPFSLLKKNRETELSVPALLFGQAGLLGGDFEKDYPRDLQKEYRFLQHKYQLESVRPELWKFLRSRPANFPTLRIAQLAAFLRNTDQLFDLMLRLDRIDHLLEAFQVKVPEFWYNHYHFTSRSADSDKTIGARAVYSLAINAIAPFLFFYGQQSGKEEYKEKAVFWLETIPAESNSKVNHFVSLRPGLESALESQAMIQLYDHFCSAKACLKCAVAGFLIKK